VDHPGTTPDNQVRSEVKEERLQVLLEISVVGLILRKTQRSHDNVVHELLIQIDLLLTM